MPRTSLFRLAALPLLFLLPLCPPAPACMQISEENTSSDNKFTGDFSRALQGRTGFVGYPKYLQTPAQVFDWQKLLQTTETKLLQAKDNPSITDLTAKGVALAHLGRLQESLNTFLYIEKLKPTFPLTPANLGTVYELMGQNELALQWIKEGYRRNPKALQGSEWLHVRILEAKVAMTHNPDWLRHHSILGWNWGTGWTTARPENLTDAEIDRLISALHYQLRERMEFVKPPDPIVAQLLYDLGNLAALRANSSTARDILKTSVQYKPVDHAMVENKLDYHNLISLLLWPFNRTFVSILLWSLFALLLALYIRMQLRPLPR